MTAGEALRAARWDIAMIGSEHAKSAPSLALSTEGTAQPRFTAGPVRIAYEVIGRESPHTRGDPRLLQPSGTRLDRPGDPLLLPESGGWGAGDPVRPAWHWSVR